MDMEKVIIRHESGITETLMLGRLEYLLVLDLGRRFGYTRGNEVFISKENTEAFLPELYEIRGLEFRMEAPRFC